MADNPIIYVNPHFQKLTGYSADEIIGKNCRFLQGPESDKTVVRECHDAIHSNVHFRGELVNYRKDGSLFWNHLTVSPVKDEAGNALFFVGIQLDVTEQKMALLERDKLIEELNAINTGLNRFALTTSHELKNPLSVIIGFAHMLRDRYLASLDQKAQHLLERISANALYLSRCLDDLRQFGSLGHAPLKFEPVNLASLIRDVVSVLGIEAESSYVHFSQSLPTITCNFPLMMQVFRNLIDNAVKYGMGQEQGIFIDARLRENNWCQIEVSDRGPGVLPNILRSIFDPFVSSGESTGGTGLGLAIVKKIIEVHKGHIRCQSGSQGTTFTIEIPTSGLALQSESHL
ncbi:MAG: PAS domain-containing protein [Bdellovibrionales bacterium]|nr:PAS domain-containing protein [Bdellovibrionales bacterium]